MLPEVVQPPEVEDVAFGHATKLRWNIPDDRIWSTDPVVPPGPPGPPDPPGV
jgi:hypothetical protein